MQKVNILVPLLLDFMQIIYYSIYRFYGFNVLNHKMANVL